MTALAGSIDWSGRPDADRRCAAMMDAQALYAGGARETWSADGVALGRFAHPHLPPRGLALGAGGRLILIADLRLDNRGELARALGGEPPADDAALLMHAIEAWGDDAASRLVGEFAFALWDKVERRLTLARDYLGQRPLHLVRRAGGVDLASMPTGLHALAEIPRAPDLAAMAGFLGRLPEMPDESYFAGIDRVPPGAVMTIGADEVHTRSFWAPARPRGRGPSIAEAHEALRAEMDRATAARIGDATQVATQLSGGLDSSTVTATAARLLDGRGTVTALTSVPRPGFPTESDSQIIDEGAHAGAVAALYPNVDHVRITPSAGLPLIDSIARAARLYQRPAQNSGNESWLGAISDAAAARGLTRLLHASMGNLAFSHNGTERLAQLLARGQWLTLARNLRGLKQAGHAPRSLALTTAAPLLPRPLWRLAARRRGHLIADSLLRPGFAAEIRLDERAHALRLDPQHQPPLDAFERRSWALKRTDAGVFIKGMLGGWGLEFSDPTADQQLMQFTLSLGAEHYLADGETRALARRAFADRLPPTITGERRKGLQAADWYLTVQAERDAIIAEAEQIAASAAAREVIDTESLLAMARAIPAGEWTDAGARQRFRTHVLRALAAGHFIRTAGG